MRTLIVVMSLAVLSSSQAIAGKRLSFLKKWKTPSSISYMPRISRDSMASAVGVALFSAASAVLFPEATELIMGTAVAGNLSIAGGGLWETGNADHMTEMDQVGTQVLYSDGNGFIRRGEVISGTLGDSELRIKERLTRTFFIIDGSELRVEEPAQTTADFFKIAFKHEHPDSLRLVETLKHVGHVINVFNDGFYELELFAAVDSSKPHVEHVAIKPYRIIVDESVSLEDGGFRFTR